MHNARPSCIKVVSADKHLFEINLMKDFAVSSVSSLQTKGHLGPYQISMTEPLWEKSERFLTAIFLKKLNCRYLIRS